MSDFCRLTPHYNERRPRLLIIHGMALDWAVADDILCGRSEYEVSCNYAISQNAETVKYTEDHDRAWHAGVSYWSGFDADLNSMSVGIELQCACRDPEFAAADCTYSDVQIEQLIVLARKIVTDYRIAPWHVLAHQDIAPGRKPDPGIHFPWVRLAKEGIGLWHDLEPVTDDPVVTDPQRLAQFRRDLTFYGYDSRPEIAGEGHVNVIKAFQTHFLPWNICGLATEQSVAALAILLEKKYGSFAA
jgi:N-acetyl-anhydromuramyl-L-alanine amidase AmpD